MILSMGMEIIENRFCKLSNKGKFKFLFQFDIVLIFLLTVSSFFLASAISRRNLVFTALSAILCVLVVAFIFKFTKLAKSSLGKLLYTYENIYLFRKYTFYFEAIITCALAFLLGMNSAFADFLHITDENILFLVNAFLVSASCIGTCMKITLQYTNTIWESAHKKKGNVVPIERSKNKS